MRTQGPHAKDAGLGGTGRPHPDLGLWPPGRERLDLSGVLAVAAELANMARS